jgi:hypothetical protein
MRAASPLVVLLVVLSWTLPEPAGAQTRITVGDGVLDKVAPPDPVAGLRHQVEGVRDTTAGVVEKVLSPAPVTVVAEKVLRPAPATVVVSSPQRSTGSLRSNQRAPATRKRSSHRRDKERAGSSNRQDRDTRQPDKRDDIHRVAAVGNDIHPTEVKGLTLTASRRTLLAVTGVYLLTWMAAALFLIGLGALSLLSSRPRFASFSLRA